MTRDVIVVGGGIVGLGVALRARERGMTVTVLDPGGDDGAWWVAAGMLAPVSEAQAGDEPHLALGLESAARWPAFAEELGVGLRRRGTLIVARDRDDAEALDRLHRFRTSLGVEAERLLPTAARRLEPALAPTVRLALDVPGDRAVDPRAVVAALRERVEVTPGRVTGLLTPDVLRTQASSPAVAPDLGRQGDISEQQHGGGEGRVTGVRLEDGTALHAGAVVVAAGAHSGAFGAPVRPVRGQVLRLRDPRGPGLVERCIRTLDAYLVPRDDGRYVLGATMEERGWDAAPTAGGTFELLRDLGEVVPGILELELEATLVGFRPGTPDNAPLLGPDPDRAGLHWATGHWRNGVLLTPASADAVVAGLLGEPLPDWTAGCRADRLADSAGSPTAPAALAASARGSRS